MSSWTTGASSSARAASPKSKTSRALPRRLTEGGGEVVGASPGHAHPGRHGRRRVPGGRPFGQFGPQRRRQGFVTGLLLGDDRRRTQHDHLLAPGHGAIFVAAGGPAERPPPNRLELLRD